MKFRKRWIAVILLLIISLFGWNFLREKIYVSDGDFIMHQNILSPDGKHRIIKFEIDPGAWGSHWGTAITSSDFQDLNLAKYKIPRCYTALGWIDASELIIAMEDCKSYKQDELKTGDIFQDVKVRVVNADEFLLKQGIERKKTVLPPSLKAN